MINNTLSIIGSVQSLQLSRINNSRFSENDAYVQIGNDYAGTVLKLAGGDASVDELRRAIATVGDLLDAGEYTLRDVEALVNETFWRRLNLTVEAEFVLISTGHGMTTKATLLVKSNREEVA